jgi:cobaltochelatase CobS
MGLRIGQRLKLTTPNLIADGFTYGDVVTDHGNGYVTVLTIHREKGPEARFKLRIGPSDYQVVSGKPPFPKIDGERKNFGANRKGGSEKAAGAGEGEGDEDGDEEGEGDPEDGKAEKDAPEEKDEAKGEPKAGKNGLMSALEKMMRDIAKAEVAKGGGKSGGSTVIKVGDLPPVELEGQPHSALERVLKLVAAGVSKRNVMLVGPAGCGKTTLGSQVAEVLKLRFAAISCSPGMSESKLLGRVVPNVSSGEEKYHESPIVKAYVDGGVILLDEMDNADPSILLVLNMFLDNGHVVLPNGELAIRHKSTVVIASANTYGHGADRIYVGRSALDGATLDRFRGATLNLDYDTKLEAHLCPEKNIRDEVYRIRSKVAAAKLRRIVSTRFLMDMRKLVLGVGDSMQEAVRACTTDWTEADRVTVGIK